MSMPKPHSDRALRLIHHGQAWPETKVIRHALRRGETARIAGFRGGHEDEVFRHPPRYPLSVQFSPNRGMTPNTFGPMGRMIGAKLDKRGVQELLGDVELQLTH